MRGVHGDKAVFDGPYGFYQVFFRGAYDQDKLLAGLGERYETAQVSLKPWPSRRTLHRTITAVLDVMAAHDLSFERIAHVDVLVGAVNRPWCQPVRTGQVPRHRIDLLNNMLFAVGAAIRHGDVMLGLYCDPALADDVVLNAVPKVRWHEVAASGAGAISEPGKVRIVTVDGQVLEGRCEVPLGHPMRPMSPAQLRAKFAECAAHAMRPVGPARVAEIVDTVRHLEELKDVAELTRLLA
jgi:2-methylcitrate dehydratase PrpD